MLKAGMAVLSLLLLLLLYQLDMELFGNSIEEGKTGDRYRYRHVTAG